MGIRIDNESVPDPTSSYGATKLLAGHLATLYNRRIADGITGVRFSTVYGFGKQLLPGRPTAVGWLAELIDKPAAGEPGRVSGGRASFDFQYVEDAARAVLAALDAPDTGGRCYLTHGDQRPVREAFDHVRRLLPDWRTSTPCGHGPAGSWLARTRASSVLRLGTRCR